MSRDEDRGRPQVPEDARPDDAEQPSPARSKTMCHLRRLLLVGAAGGAASQCTGCPIVCDPLPPPMQCSADPGAYALFERLYPGATWQREATEWVVAVRMTYSPYGDDDPVTFTGPPVIVGGTLRGHAVTGATLEFTFLPDAGATTVEVTVPLDCDTFAVSLRFTADVSGTPTADGYVPVSVLAE